MMATDFLQYYLAGGGGGEGGRTLLNKLYFLLFQLTENLGLRGFEKKRLAKGAIRSEEMTAEEMTVDRHGRCRKINTS